MTSNIQKQKKIMKKHYMAPKAEIVQLTLEGMVAASKTLTIGGEDDSYVGEQQLSGKQESIWDNDIWNEDK